MCACENAHSSQLRSGGGDTPPEHMHVLLMNLCCLMGLPSARDTVRLRSTCQSNRIVPRGGEGETSLMRGTYRTPSGCRVSIPHEVCHCCTGAVIHRHHFDDSNIGLSLRVMDLVPGRCSGTLGPDHLLVRVTDRTRRPKHRCA